MKRNVKPIVSLLVIAGLLLIYYPIKAQINNCLLNAGEDLEVIDDGLPIDLEATSVNITDIRWGTYGDGYFTHDDRLITDYFPGDGDLEAGHTTLYIESDMPERPLDDIVDFYTISSGDWGDANIWNTGSAPPQNINGQVIVLKHDVYVSQGIIKLNQGAKLYAENVHLIMYPNRSFIIQDAEVYFRGGTFLQLNTLFDGSSNANSVQGDLLLTEESSKLVMNGTDVWVNGNFHNNGTRILQDVQLKVDRHFHNNGSDVLINVCAEVATEIRRNGGGGNGNGNGPGNIHNSASAEAMYVENTTMYTYNGNMVNNSVIIGSFAAIRIEDGSLVNTGTWDASIDKFCVDHNTTGSYAEQLPEMDCEAADAAIQNCITSSCATAYDEVEITFIEDTTDVVIYPPVVIGGGGDDDDGPVKGDDGGGPSWPLDFSVRNSGKFQHPVLDVYPNPVQADGQINFRSGLSGQYRVRVVSLNGSVHYDDIRDVSQPLDLARIPSLNAGIYAVELIVEKYVLNSRFAILGR